jgi:hypothetical protein
MRWSNRYRKLATEFLDGPEWAASTGRTAKIESLTVLLARVRDEAVSTANPPRKSLLWWFKPRQIKVGDAVLVKAKVYELMDNGIIYVGIEEGNEIMGIKCNRADVRGDSL